MREIKGHNIGTRKQILKAFFISNLCLVIDLWCQSEEKFDIITVNIFPFY